MISNPIGLVILAYLRDIAGFLLKTASHPYSTLNLGILLIKTILKM